jgi:hypothetical protein
VKVVDVRGQDELIIKFKGRRNELSFYLSTIVVRGKLLSNIHSDMLQMARKTIQKESLKQNSSLRRSQKASF